METQIKLAVIGGSGLEEIPGLEDIQKIELDTPFGKPSAPIVVGSLEGRRIAFLSRHGIGHHLSPTEVNYRGNIYALKSLGVERVVSISACGSLREDYSLGELVVPDQLYDFTRERKRTFFGEGFVAHISSADPYCKDLSRQVYNAVQATGATVHTGGTYITIEGPRFSTRAESNTFRMWGMSLIGMTSAPEAFLAREAEMCYSIMAHVTDLDVWDLEEEPVSVDAVIEVLNRNTQIAQKAIANLARDLSLVRDCDCKSALENAFITDPDVVPEETRQRLSLFIDKYLD